MNLEMLKDSEAEKAVLMALMKDTRFFAELNNRLTVADFYSPAHQEIFKGLQEMFDTSEKVDLVTLSEHLNKSGALDRIGGVTVLTAIYNGFSLPGAFNKHVQILLDMSHRRYLHRLSQEIHDSAHDMSKEIAEIDSGISDSLDALHKTPNTNVVEISESLVNAYEDMHSNRKHGLMSGFMAVDQMSRGFMGGNLIIIAGRPAMGKTALALNILSNICNQGKGVLMVSLEMSVDELSKRLISSLARANEADIRNQVSYDEHTANDGYSEDVKKSRNRISSTFWARVNQALDTIHGWNLGLIEKGSCSVRDIKTAAKIRQRQKGLDLIVIDYLQLMSVEGYKDNRVGEISYLTRHLKLLAKELNIPILVLSQLSRAVEQRNNKRPTLADLRDSGSIEQDADKVLMIYRDGYYYDDGDKWTEIIIAKNRNGASGTVKLNFTPEYTLFSDWQDNSIPGKEVKNFVEVF